MRAAIPDYLGNRYIPGVSTDCRRITFSGYETNEYDACLSDDKQLWDSIMAQGLSQTCCPRGRQPYKERPWITQPSEGRHFQEIGSTPVSGLTFDGTDQIVLSFPVPIGYDGIINYISCGIDAAAATGFVEGSGDLRWRLSANVPRQRFLRNYGNILFSLGSLLTPCPIPNGGLRIFSKDQIVFYIAPQASGIGVINPDGVIVCSCSGWFYPR